MKPCARALRKDSILPPSPRFREVTTKSPGTISLQKARQLASKSDSSVPTSNDGQSSYSFDLAKKTSKRRHGDAETKDLVLDILGSSATKRDAKTYLSRFGPIKRPPHRETQAPPSVKSVGVNLGNLYLPLRSVEESPVFSQKTIQPRFTAPASDSLHVALVKIRSPQSLDDKTLRGVGLTLSQLSKLGLGCAIVVDFEEGQTSGTNDGVRSAREQADRLVDAIYACGGRGARRLDSILGISLASGELHPFAKGRGRLSVTHRNLLMAPLRSGLIPVITPIAYIADRQSLISVEADEVVLALTREFAGIQTIQATDEDPKYAAEEREKLQKQVSLDRIIILDPVGGIPSVDRFHGPHVFINLEQEFDAIKKELLAFGFQDNEQPTTSFQIPPAKDPSAAFTLSNPFSRLLDVELKASKSERELQQSRSIPQLETKNIAIHIRNLDLLKKALSLLPPSSSAFLATPQEVANSSNPPSQQNQVASVRTRRHRNLLIHNLLTDKPTFSSSLPTQRSQDPTSTFLKRGMPVTILPDPTTNPWTPTATPLSLSDPRLDLPRLVHLIEDSFSRKLDVEHYLNRVASRLAGVIIAGSYEGGALLTWETPPNYPANDDRYKVPYLDKFAVLKRSQGAGGVADVVFSAMVRECFPQGVCWRSRRDNPVNGWYFERARGTWKIPGTGWTMFWTTPGVEGGDYEGVFGAYEAVCRSVEPSWADNTGVID